MANRIHLHPDGWRVSKPGINAITNTDPRNFLLDIGYADPVPIVSEASASVSAGSSANINVPTNGTLVGYLWNYYSNAGGKVYSSSVTNLAGGQDLAFINGRDLCMGFEIEFNSFSTGYILEIMMVRYDTIVSGNWRFIANNPWAQSITVRLLIFGAPSK